ncbi:MAG: ATP synthase F1 subunit delta [Acidobacteriia bacterium]|nr:ATP synthase F1 subunit delta [Terriglobia bacterium]
MTVSAIAVRYADALADVVTAPGAALRPQDALAELQSFEAALRSSVNLRNALISPAVPGSRKKAVVARVGDVLGLSRITRNFLFVLIDHRRIAGLAEVVQIFEQKVDERLGFASAQVVSARELTEAQRTALNAELERRAGKRIRMRVSVDDALIGGVMARIGSTVYDGSVRGRLQSLERRLTAERYS